MNQLIVLRIVCLAIGYVFGLFQTAYIVGRTRGIDIREHGSGNSGTTNAMRILGKKAGLIVFLGDVLKSLLALLLVGFLFGKTHPEAVYLLKTWTFAGVVLGHDYPFYMGFRGGKGVAVMAGYVFGFHWSFILPGILMFFIPYLITGYVSLGSLILYLGLFIQLVIEGTRGVFDISGPMLTELIVIQGLLTAMAWYRHRANIGRLLSGTERKTHLIKRNSEQLDLDKK
ncbi:MAG: glycerol-3-phosphate acyltransferase [Lachnospiraceae bacterium]|nr:glycerol-3-phosphate acyltransferase [Lachnospiraceae bacterium]